MKKSGFTLAEVMVAMALIGIIASLTIPTFISSSRNKANAAKLATVVSSVENAFTSMIASEAVQDLSETKFGADRSENNLNNYLKLAGSNTQLTSYYDSATPFVTLNKTATELPVTRVFQTKNGALLAFNDSVVAAPADDSHPGSIGQLTIDVNGKAKPNVWGRDVFWFRVGNDGLLYPAGGDKFAKMDQNGKNMSCTKESRNQGCTARLIENNYEIDY